MVGRAAAADDVVTAKLAALDRTVMLRVGGDGKTYGRNEVDPLLWSGSNYFTHGASRDRLRAALATVQGMSDAEIGRCPPAQRALVQNRVWTVFDHVLARQKTPNTNRDLLHALAHVIEKLALTEQELGAISDPLHEAIVSGRFPAEPTSEGGPTVFLPPDLGPAFSHAGGQAIARHHLRTFGGRSSFALHVKMPAGGPDPAAYFKAVSEFPQPWSWNKAGLVVLNRDVPQLPAGATVALVRRLAVVRRDGRWAVSPLVMSVQLRRYHVTDWPTVEKRRAERTDGMTGHLQSFTLFELETENIGAGYRTGAEGSGGLRPIEESEKRFGFFFAHGFDQVERSGDYHFPNFVPGPQHEPLKTCSMCHSGVGLQSLNSLGFIDVEHTVPLPRLIAADNGANPEREAGWKETRAEWGALMMLWPTGGR